ncbi:MAG: periplasmic heavy metal sensor [Verrucomicrobiota bacterium]
MNKTIWILIVSLLLNVFLLGLVIGKWGHRSADRWKYNPEFNKHNVEAQLSAKLGEKVLPRLMQIHSVAMDLRDEVMQTRGDILEIMTADNFDKQAFQAEVIKMSSLHEKNVQKMVQVLSELASELSKEEREILAQLLIHHGPGLYFKKPSRGPEKLMMKDYKDFVK